MYALCHAATEELEERSKKKMSKKDLRRFESGNKSLFRGVPTSIDHSHIQLVRKTYRPLNYFLLLVSRLSQHV